MKSSTFTPLRLALPLAVLLLAGCKKSTPDPEPTATGSFAFEMENVAGTTPLVLGSQTVTKADGQTYKVTKFKYLLSNVKLTRANGSTYDVPNSYYLIDAEKPASLHFIIDDVPVGTYTGLSFVVGVDAAHNNPTFESGDLNHNNDLFWDMPPVAGYVFLKMAGTSSQSRTGGLTFDIGGNNCARVVAPTFGTSTLPVAAGHVPEIHMTANVNALFDNANPARMVKFDQTHSVASGDAWAPTIADNYAAGMFTIEHIHAN